MRSPASSASASPSRTMPTAATGWRAAAGRPASASCRSATAPGTRSRRRCGRRSAAEARIETLDHAPLEALDPVALGLARDARAARGGTSRSRPGAIVLAAGGRCFAEAQRLGTFSTNAAGATGEVTEIALAAGCEARDLDALQYHPNGGLWPVVAAGVLDPRDDARLRRRPAQRRRRALRRRARRARRRGRRDRARVRGGARPDDARGQALGAARLPADRGRRRRDLAAVHAAAATARRASTRSPSRSTPIPCCTTRTAAS